jgi:hypothetical protein
MQTEHTLRNLGLSLVRRELASRIPYYLNSDEQRKQAGEWAEQELAKPAQEKAIANMRETKRFYGPARKHFRCHRHTGCGVANH